MTDFASGHTYFGLHVQANRSIIYREYAPNAIEASLIGEFSSVDFILDDWDRSKHPMHKDDYGVWSVVIESVNGKVPIPHNSKLKITMKIPSGEWIDRLPAWIKRVTQDLEKSVEYDAVFWNPPNYQWKNSVVECPLDLRIYEAHGNELIN